jgi:ring-1,2-phenylacetyl-CoA epoxidase subunit PaaE
VLKFHPLKLKARTSAAEDAVCLTFEVPPELREAYRFEAGQHLGLRLKIDGEETRRTYSIVSPAHGADLSIGVRVQPGGRISHYLAERVRIGEALEVLTPNGSFHTRLEPARAKDYVAFAAGSGITPVMSIAATVLEAEPLSRFILFYGNRSTSSTMFLEELLALKDRFVTRFAVHFVMSREPQDIELFNGRLTAAKIRELAQACVLDPARTDEFFLCGPGSMVEDLNATLRDLGATGRIHTELFRADGAPASAVEVSAAGRSGAAEAIGVPAPAGDLAQVAVVMDGRRRVFNMPMDGEAILDAAARHGIELPFSCRAGVCSTCRTKVVRGRVEMAQNFALEDWEVEAGYVLCCQSRPTSPELEITYDER